MVVHTLYLFCQTLWQEWCWRGWFRQRTKEQLVTPPRRDHIPRRLLHQRPALISPCLIVYWLCAINHPQTKQYIQQSRMLLSWKGNSDMFWSDNGSYLWRVKRKNEGHLPIIVWSLKKAVKFAHFFVSFNISETVILLNNKVMNYGYIFCFLFPFDISNIHIFLRKPGCRSTLF